MSAIVPVADLERMAIAIAKSGLFGSKTAEQAMALMLVAQAEGLHPAVAARDYDIIQGRPALKARAMQGRFQSSGGKIEWVTRTDTECEAIFSHPQSPRPVSIKWDMKRAAQAGLNGKDNWKKFPAQMLAARVVSEGVTACYPAATSGFYTPEEVIDMGPPKDMGPAEIVPDVSSVIDEKQLDELAFIANEVKADVPKFLSYLAQKGKCEIATMADIPAVMFKDAKAALESKRGKA